MATPKAFASLSLALLLVASPLCCMAENVLYSKESLKTGNYLFHATFMFIMQSDCNLVLYDGGNPMWASNTGGLGRQCYCTLESNGNLVVYNQNNRPVWESNTNVGQGNYVLLLQKDRNVVIYGSSRWATNTIISSVTGDMFVESKARILVPLPANETTAEAKTARNIAMVVNK